MDKVYITGLKVGAIIGVYDFEHDAPQPLVIDLELGTDFSQAFDSDELCDVLDYNVISKMVRSFCESSQYKLLEALAGGIIKLLFGNQSSIRNVAIRIRKPQALTGAMASVWCERCREQM
ncbi:MAG: dihydroneopterin aldolase [Candidatus Endonucleobacter bathymodioli]|uniref:7,8-dihydroneopterin aldolase n=1 Tax=Candidatus Endonucleibacter bathymodioli TaxID=539814 RepID=A0AA90NTW7_9GAMM|nr:dihydroneopterin aldolase [Candidatus Endonucleobacter bathymodioli]